MIREQGVGSSNLPAPTNSINGLPLSLERWATFSATFSSLKDIPSYIHQKSAGEELTIFLFIEPRTLDVEQLQARGRAS